MFSHSVGSRGGKEELEEREGMYERGVDHRRLVEEELGRRGCGDRGY